MSNIFSSFDPKTFMFSMNWISSLLFLVLLPLSFFINVNQNKKVVKGVILYLFFEFKMIFSPFMPLGVLLPSLGVFIFIVSNNFLGLFPYIFTSSAHLSFTLSLTIPLWAGHYFLSWKSAANSNLAHLVPQGSPLALSPFMVLIELVSNLIRPITLSVRLAANMVAGHLLMTLLSGPLGSLSFNMIILGLFALSLLVILESAVAFIQSYVFSVLSVLYVNEIDKNAHI